MLDNRIGFVHLMRKEFQQAYSYCWEAISNYIREGLENKVDKKKILKAKLLISLGDVGYQRASFNDFYKPSDSLENYQEALQIYKTHLGENHSEIIELLRKIKNASSPKPS